jgi:DNA polymerase IV
MLLSFLQKSKTIVTPLWVEDSLLHERMMPVIDYIPIEELKQLGQSSQAGSSKDAYAKVDPPVPLYPQSQLQAESSSSSGSKGAYTPRYTSSYACQRHSPLVCPNQDLIEELMVIKRAREVDGDMRSMLSYSRAISVRFFFTCFNFI